MRLFYPVLIAFIFLICWVNWRLLVKWYPRPYPSWFRYGYWLITLAACSSISYSWLTRFNLPLYQWLSPMAYPGFIWVTGEIVLLVCFPLLFVVRRLVRGTCNEPETEPSEGLTVTRRAFLQNTLYAVPVLAFVPSTFGVCSAEATMTVRRLNLSWQELPTAFNGLKIAQISDTHLGPYFNLGRLDYVLRLVKKEKPDLVVITGDLIDDLDLLTASVDKLTKLAATIPFGMFFCWGNHEYFRDVNRIRRELAKSPVTILENTSVPLQSGGESLYLLGVDYPRTNSATEREMLRHKFMEKAVVDVPAGAFQILLAHHPDFLFDGFARRIPLTLAGHTHGGQVRVFGHSLLPVHYDFMGGLYQENETYGYVNIGAGQWFPFRLGCPPEISIFTLKNS